MPKKKASQTKALHGQIEDSTFNLEVAGESMIALHNALAFTIAHKEEYSDSIELCDHCIDAMNAVRRNIAQILSYTEIYDTSKKLSN